MTTQTFTVTLAHDPAERPWTAASLQDWLQAMGHDGATVTAGIDRAAAERLAMKLWTAEVLAGQASGTAAFHASRAWADAVAETVATVVDDVRLGWALAEEARAVLAANGPMPPATDGRLREWRRAVTVELADRLQGS